MPPKKSSSEAISGLTRADLDDMIARAVHAAVDVLSTELNNYFDKQFEKLNQTQNDLKADNVKLKEKVTEIHAKMTVLETNLSRQNAIIEDQKNLINQTLKWTNKNEQYSRRNNLKIYGLERGENENCRLAVSNLITNILGIPLKEGDIATAHPLPRRNDRNDGDQNAQERPLPVIVQFSSAARDRRDEALKRRKQLKGSKTVIYEDLTEMNSKLMKSVKNHPEIKNAWSHKGRVMGITKAGKKIRFEHFEDITHKIAFA